MPIRTAEAFILRTYPLKESDRIVVFFTREFGKCRGVARGARRPKSRYGSSLEPFSRVRVQYFEREGRELYNLDHCELLASAVSAAASGFLASMVLACMVELADRILPEHEANDNVFRLLDTVLSSDLRTESSAWLAFTYYLYWMVRLGGFLPEFARGSVGARALAARIAGNHLAQLSSDAPLASAAPGRELRRFLVRQIEDHIEVRLQSWPMLADLEFVEGPQVQV